MKINFSNVSSSPPAVEVFFGPEKGQAGAGDIIGLAASTLSSSVFINIKNRGLFAYKMNGMLHWSAGTVLSQYGYSLGCRKGVKDCSFSSTPVVDRCEASLYVSFSALFFLHNNFLVKVTFLSAFLSFFSDACNQD